MISEKFTQKRYAPDVSEEFNGGVDICIAPPFNSAHVIEVTRLLRSEGIKMRQTSGSWRDGCTITVLLDKPLPLVGILNNSENVRDARVIHRQIHRSTDPDSESTSSLSFGRSELTKIMVNVNWRN